MLGVDDVNEEEIDPNLVNAGKIPVGETRGASFFNSADSFGMIRGGHVDVAILGVLQVDEHARIANWAVPGKNIIGVGGAMDLLVGAKKVIVTMTHTSKDGKSKILKECTYPITSTRSVDMIITELAVFQYKDESITFSGINARYNFRASNCQIPRQHLLILYRREVRKNEGSSNCR